MSVNRKYLHLALFILLISAFYAAFWLINSKAVKTAAAQFTAEQLSSSLGQKCAVSAVSVYGNDGLLLTGLKIDDSDGTRLADAEKVTVLLNPLAVLLNRDNPERVISEVNVEGAVLKVIERADGTWNIEDLLPQGKSNVDFRGKINLANVKLGITLSSGQTIALMAEGMVDCAEKNKAAVDLKIMHGSDTADIKGIVDNLAAGTGELCISSERLQLDELARFFPPNLKISNFTGALTKINITAEKRAEGYNFQGRVQAEGIGASVKAVPFYLSKADILFDKQKVSIKDALIEVEGKKLQADAFLYLAKERLLLSKAELSVKADDFSVGDISAFLPAEMQLDNFSNIEIKQLQARAVCDFAAKKVILENLRTVVADGTITLSAVGTYKDIMGKDINNFSGKAVLAVSDLDTAQFSEMVGTSISGKLGGVADFSWSEGKLLTSANIKMTTGSVLSLPFASLQAGIATSNNSVSMPYLVLTQQGGGCVTAHGDMAADGNINGGFAVTDLELLQLALSDERLKGSTGKINAEGNISGSLFAPVINGTVFAADGAIFYQPYKEMHANFAYDAGMLSLKDCWLKNDSQSYSMNGNVDVAAGNANLTLSLDNVRAENLVKVLPEPPKLTGNVTAVMHVRGSLKAPLANLDFILSEGSFSDILLSDIRGKANYAAGKLFLSETIIKAYDSEFVVSGELTNAENFKFAINSKKINLGTLPNKTDYDLEGQAAFSGWLSGSMAQPVLQGTLTSEEVYLNNQPLNALVCEVSCTTDLIIIEKLFFRQGRGSINFKGGLYLRDEKLFGIAQAEKTNILFLANVLKKEQITGMSGDLDGTLVIGGVFGQPDIWLTGRVPYAYVNKYLIKDVELDIAIEDSMLIINKLRANQGAGFFAAQGSMDLRGIKNHKNRAENGVLQIDVGANNIDAGLAVDLLGLPIDVEGQLTFAAQLSGTTKKPDINISVEVDQLQWGSANFDKLTALAVIDKDNININQAMLARGEYKASAYGVIPFKAIEGNLKNLKGNEQMDLNMKIDNADLQILSIISPAIKKASGNIEGDLIIKGTLNEPQFFGKLKVDNGFIAIKDVMRPLEKIKVDILLENDKIDINQVSGKMGKGDFMMTGSARFDGWLPKDYDVNLALNSLQFKNNWISIPIKGELRLYNNGNMPKVEGSVNFDGQKIEILRIPQLNDTPFPFDCALDIAIDCGEKTHVSNDLLFDLVLSGKAVLQGSTLHPDSYGELDIKKGNLSYLSINFALDRQQESKITFGNYNTFLPTVDISAATKMADIDISMDVKGKLPNIAISFSSQPKMSQAEIMTMLTLGVPFTQGFESTTGAMSSFGQNEMMAFLSMGFQMKLVRNFEKGVQETLGIDDLRVVSVILPGGGVNNRHFSLFFSPDQRNNQSIYAASVSKTFDKLSVNARLGMGYNYYDVSMGYKVANDTYVGVSTDNTTGVNDREIYIRKNWTF